MRDYAAARRAVWYRENGVCLLCGGGLHQVHHRQGRGGDDPHRLSNVIGLCRSCHDHAHAHPSESYGYGVMIPRLGVRTPEEAAIRTRHGWVYLDNIGSMTPYRKAS